MNNLLKFQKYQNFDFSFSCKDRMRIVSKTEWKNKKSNYYLIFQCSVCNPTCFTPGSPSLYKSRSWLIARSGTVFWGGFGFAGLPFMLRKLHFVFPVKVLDHIVWLIRSGVKKTVVKKCGDWKSHPKYGPRIFRTEWLRPFVMGEFMTCWLDFLMFFIF